VRTGRNFGGETRREWEKLGGTRGGVRELRKERVVRFGGGGGGIGRLGELTY